MTHTILLIEDQSLVRTSLSALLNSSTPFSVTQSVASVYEAIALLDNGHQFDLILCDYNLRNHTAKSLLEHAKICQLSTPIILLTSLFNAVELQSCLSMGARGFLFKESTLDEITRALHQVIEGGCYFASPKQNAEDRVERSGDPHPLTPTEKEILHWLATGMSNKQIALALCKSTETVKVHTAKILKKLNCKTRTQAVFKAAQLNWL